jgi:ribosomal protein S27AE
MENINYFNDPDERLGKTCPKCGSSKISFLAMELKDEWVDLIKSGEIVYWTSCVGPPYNLICRDRNMPI